MEIEKNEKLQKIIDEQIEQIGKKRENIRLYKNNLLTLHPILQAN